MLRKTGNEGKEGKYHPKNALNDLTGREWLQFTKSWFVHNPPPRSKSEILHPAKFPESLVSEFIEFFTKKGETVLDPFLGTASTLIACQMTGRRGIGIELVDKWHDIAAKRLEQPDQVTKQEIIKGDAAKIREIWEERELPPVDFVITSPPYWNMLGKSRGGVKSTQKQRKDQGLAEVYSDLKEDLGNITGYTAFIEALGKTFDDIHRILRENGYLVIIVQNVREPRGEVKPLAWDLARRVGKNYLFQGEKIWCQDNKKLGIWGYPKIFVPNYHHHYCLIFQKRELYVNLKNKLEKCN
ncbi:MAG: DNA methyltransferase [Candidatus Odinarchaeota archaeon]